MNEGSHAGGRRGVRTGLLLAICLTGIAGLVLCFQLGEPSHQGRPLLDWIQELGAPGDQQQAQAAVRAIGPKAVPFLLGKVRRSRFQQSSQQNQATVWETVWNNLPSGVKECIPPPGWENYDLLLNKVPIALSLLGPAVLPELITAAQDSNAGVQWVAVRAIGMMGPAAESALPVLTQLLETTNDVRGIAALAIGQMGPARTQAIAALIKALPSTEYDAARTLGAMGADAAAAVPALTALLDSPQEHVRLQAATAVWQITRDTNLVERIIKELGNRQGYSTYKGFLNLLGEMGPAAQPAVPAILSTMTNWGTDMSRPVRPVLLKIDPKAARVFDEPE